MKFMIIREDSLEGGWFRVQASVTAGGQVAQSMLGVASVYRAMGSPWRILSRGIEHSLFCVNTEGRRNGNCGQAGWEGETT